MAHSLIAMLLTLGDGFRLCSQLPGNELFECRHAGLLFRSLVRQASEVPKVFGHLFDNGSVGFEVRLVAGDEIAPMATVSGVEGLSDCPEQLYQFGALGIEHSQRIGLEPLL